MYVSGTRHSNPVANHIPFIGNESSTSSSRFPPNIFVRTFEEETNFAIASSFY